MTDRITDKQRLIYEAWACNHDDVYGAVSKVKLFCRL